MPGDWVEVRSADEVAATLDADGSVEGLPFMPEMAAHCGRRFRVQLRAERTCTFPYEHGHRRLDGVVVLRTLRCDGALHGGCQLGCMMFWKEVWLRPIAPPSASEAAASGGSPAAAADDPRFPARRRDDPSRFVCQGTELVRASRPGPPSWEPLQYVQLLRSRTFTPVELAGVFAGVARRRLDRVLHPPDPAGPAPGVKSSARQPLGLTPGDWVVVKDRDAIRETLDAAGKYRGLSFAATMYEYCGRKMRVAAVVQRIVDERTGKLREIPPGTVLLEGCICDRYRGCGRNMPIMWREVWLERAVPQVAAQPGRAVPVG